LLFEKRRGSFASSLFKLQTSPKVSEKKGAICQSFIRKEITTYRIGTLAKLVFFNEKKIEKDSDDF